MALRQCVYVYLVDQACRVTGDGKGGGIQGSRGSCPCRQNNPRDFLMCLVPGAVEEGRREPLLSMLA